MNVFTAELGDGQLRGPGFSVAAPPGSAAVGRGSSSLARSSRPSAWEPSGSFVATESGALSVRTAAAPRVTEGTLVTLVAPADALVFFDQGGRYLARAATTAATAGRPRRVSRRLRSRVRCVEYTSDTAVDAREPAR